MAERLKVAMVGCGERSGTWIGAAESIDDVKIAAFVDLDRDAATRRRSESTFANAQVSANLEAVLANGDFDAVFDCTVPATHVDVTLTALRHGCHVMGEKPLADSMDNARKMVAAAAAANRIYTVMQNRRHDENIRDVRALLAGGELGTIVSLNSDFFIGAHFGGFRDRMEHVLLLDMAIHTFDQARYLTGADPASVYCEEWNPANSWYDHDAAAVAVFGMTGGIVYSYRGSWCAEGMNTSWNGDWHIVCERGGMRWNGEDAWWVERVAMTGGFISETEIVTTEKAPHPGFDGGHQTLIADFVASVRGDKVPETVCSDNIRSLAMVFGAIESATRGQRVGIDWA